MTGTDIAAEFAEHIVSTRFSDLPDDVVGATKRSVLDTLGVMLAGSGLKDVKAIVDMTLDWGGERQAGVVGFPARTSLPHAAFLNGVMTHQLDFDDTHDAAVAHPTANSLPVALGFCETTAAASGADLLRAVALANDIVCRLGLAIRGSLYDFPWTWPPVIGIYGATAAGAAVLDLERRRIESAFGLTLHQTGNTLECLHSPGSAVRGLRDGFSCRNGVYAVEMARAGVLGDRFAFEGRFGLFNAFFRGEYDRGPLVDGLGRKFRGDEVTIKPWPGARETHATIQAAIELAAELPAPGDISRIVLHVGRTNLEFCEPLELRRRPSTRIDALRSLPYLVAATLHRGRLSVEAMHGDSLDDPAVAKLAERITCRHDPEMDAHGTIEGGRVEIVLSDGSRHERAVRHAPGHPDAPLGEEEIVAKFRDCAAHAATPFDDAATERVIETVNRLEELPLSELTDALTPWRRA